MARNDRGRSEMNAGNGEKLTLTRMKLHRWQIDRELIVRY